MNTKPNYLNLVNVACAVPRVHLANCPKNVEEIVKLARQADGEGAGIILFPELSITGYTCQDLFFQNRLLEEARAGLFEVADKTSELAALIVVGLPVSHAGRLYNCAAVLQKGELLALIPKIFIPENREYYEKRWFTSGEDLDTVIKFGEEEVPLSPYTIFVDEDSPELKVGVEICEDLWSPNPPSHELAAQGAIVILNASASNETIAKANYRRDLVAQQSARLNCAYLYDSCGFGESTQDLVFGGDAIIAERGQILARSKRFQKESFFIKAQIDVDILLHDRRVLSSYRDSTAQTGFNEIPVEIPWATTLERSYGKNPFVPSDLDEREERCEEILNIQATGLGTRLKHLGDAKMVVGVSGGLDSTLALLVSRMACDAFGWDPSRIVAVTMPGFGTTDRTYDNAVKLIGELGAQFREIPIREAAAGHLRDIGHSEGKLDETYENAQARERTQILMDLANMENGIVVGTGDLSELALGWATYNGDHMAMYGVNAGIPKTLVRYLVKYYADGSEEKLKDLLYDILDTPVSPELLPPDKQGQIQQKTEEKIGPYELHDFFLFHLVRNGFNPRKIYELACETFKDEYDPEFILKWLKTFLRRFFSQQFKRSTLPDGPKVGSVTLSPRGDWRMPTDVSSELWLADLD